MGLLDFAGIEDGHDLLALHFECTESVSVICV